jgi:signal transduction histidine kinase
MLRTRLFLNLLPFVVIMMAVGLYAIVLFSRLANSVDTSVSENYRSLVAAQEMSVALAGMEREAWIVAGWPDLDRKIFAEYKKQFDQNLAVQLKSGTSPVESELNRALQKHYEKFLATMGQIREITDAGARHELYEKAALPDAMRLNELLDQIRDVNQRAVLSTSENIQNIRREATRLMLIGIGIALVFSACACYQLSRSILRPIQSLTHATRALGEGNWGRPVPELSNDELGELARSFNKMAAQLQEYRHSTTEKIVSLHHTMETMLASFPDPIFVLDREGQIELKNPAANILMAELRLENHLPKLLRSVAEATLKTGADFLPQSFDEVVSYRLDGMDKFFLPRVVAMQDKTGARLGVAVVLYDVTRFRLLDAAKSNLVATVSHELKTPLTGVRMALHMVLDNQFGTLSARQEELMETAREDAERLLRILNNLLDLASLDERGAELRRENVAPTELLQTISQEMGDEVASRGLHLNCVASPNLPAVSVDRQRITHVFTNLVSNAIKHSPTGGEIRLSAETANGQGVEFNISDQGPGVPEQFQRRIFDRFFRVPGRMKTGAGLGLSIAREITVAHGGRIGVKSSSKRGSTFFVILKAATEEAESA